MIKFLNFVVVLFMVQYCCKDSEPKPEKISLEEKWSSEKVFETPESVLYDENRKVIFVSNIGQFNPGTSDGDGFISRMKHNGQIEKLKWVTGLNDPKGMGIKGNRLYVSDINQVVEIDIEKGIISKRYPIEGASFLNDITIDKSGNVYISDSGNNQVYILKDSVAVFLKGEELNVPNGLLAENERLMIGMAGSGDIKYTDFATRTIKPFSSGISNADGIVRDIKGNYLISNWEGEIYYVWKTGDKVQLLDTKANNVQSADIDFMREGHILLVPTFDDDRVVAYKVKYE